MEKEQAKKILNALTERSVQLQEIRRGRDSPDFEKWKRDTRVAITNIFGNSTQHIQDFENLITILYSPSYATTGLKYHGEYVKFLQSSAAILQSMIDEIDQYWTVSILETKQTFPAPSITNDPTRVLVVHGRDTRLRDSLFVLLRALGLQPIEWNQAIATTKKASPNIAEILDAAFSQAQAVIVLFTGDDEARLRHTFLKDDDSAYERELTPQSRPNVLFESGMAIGRYPERTVFLQIGAHRPFSDIAGKHITHMDNTPDKRHELATKLANAGCKVDISGNSWFSAGDFV